MIRVRAWPLELVNGVPLDARSTGEHIDELRAHVATDLFRHFEPDRFPSTTLPALALAAAGYRQDDMAGEAISFALRHALFEEGRDISLPDVLHEVADAHGIGQVGPADEAAVLADWHRGRSKEVKGSPHFFCGDLDAFCPALEISRDDDGQLQVQPNTEMLDEFVDRCLTS